MRANASISLSKPLFIAGHLALEFLNTELGKDSKRIEFLNNDAQVIEWLTLAGMNPDTSHLDLASATGVLVEKAWALRSIARQLLLARTNAEIANPDELDKLLGELNKLLSKGGAYQQLLWASSSSPERVVEHRISAPEDLLIPIAEAVVELLVDGNFTHIRKCENPKCTLWFYDRTKSHQRRWCHTSLCGNRMKAAAFRARAKAE